MISTLFFYGIYGIVYALTSPLRLLDDVAIDSSLPNAIASANGYIQGLEEIIPIGQIFAAFAIWLLVKKYMLLYKSLNWILRRIPTQS